MTANPIAAARETLAAGTPTPWEVDADGLIYSTAPSQQWEGKGTIVAEPYELADAAKITLAVNIAEPALALAEAASNVYGEMITFEGRLCAVVGLEELENLDTALDVLLATLKEAQDAD